jgi:hypothetical protein
MADRETPVIPHGIITQEELRDYRIMERAFGRMRAAMLDAILRGDEIEGGPLTIDNSIAISARPLVVERSAAQPEQGFVRLSDAFHAGMVMSGAAFARHVLSGLIELNPGREDLKALLEQAQDVERRMLALLDPKDVETFEAARRHRTDETEIPHAHHSL